MVKLYEIANDHRGLIALADESDLDITDTLEAIEGEFNDKAESLVSVVLNMDGDVTAIDSQIERLQARKTAIKNRQESMKDYLRQNMEATGIKKISCPLFTINCVEGRQIAVIDNEESLPDEFVKVKTTVSPDKNAIAKALKEGEDVPGASLQRAKSSIRIK
jgi:ectoine hydroxylase-related dioxygenase (phytanoyl-CoA dioxygenase family)